MIVYVDADGCPVKNEVYKVAGRHGLKVILVANSWMATPESDLIELVVVGAKFDAADDWIAGKVATGDIAITADIPLADRCIKNGARVLGPTGRIFDEGNIGDAMASRELMSTLRDTGIMTGGPAPFDRKDRSRFLQQLEETIRAIQRES